MTLRVVFTAAGIAVGLGICGCEPLTTTDYRGEPLVTLEGAVEGLSESSGNAPVLAMVAWHRRHAASGQEVASFDSVAMNLSSDAIDFRIAILNDPPLAVYQEDGLLAAGVIVFYEDGDGDGRFSAGADGVATSGSVDRIRGASTQQMLLHVRGSDAAAAGFLDEIPGITSAGIGSGYNVLNVSCRPDGSRVSAEIDQTPRITVSSVGEALAQTRQQYCLTIP